MLYLTKQLVHPNIWIRKIVEFLYTFVLFHIHQILPLLHFWFRSSRTPSWKKYQACRIIGCISDFDVPKHLHGKKYQARRSFRLHFGFRSSKTHLWKKYQARRIIGCISDLEVPKHFHGKSIKRAEFLTALPISRFQNTFMKEYQARRIPG